MATQRVYNLKSIMISRLIFGLYNEWFGSSWLIKLYCLSSVTVQTYFFIISQVTTDNKLIYSFSFRFLATFISVVPGFLLSVMTGDRYILLYCEWNALTDSMSHAKRFFNIHQIMFNTGFAFMIMFYVFYFVCLYIFISFAYMGVMYFILTVIIRFMIEFQRIPIYLIFSLLYCRVMIFERSVCANLVESVLQLNHHRQVYLKIIDQFEQASPALTLLTSVLVAFVFLDTLVIEYFVLNFVISGRNMTVFQISLLVWRALFNHASLLFPVILMESIAEVQERIKIRIVDQEIVSTDYNRTADLRNFLQFMIEKPIAFRVLRAIPFTFALPIGCLMLSVDYIVFFLQL